MLELPLAEPILQFTAIVALALIVQLAFERVHLPGLIGLLAIGALLGPGGWHVLPHEEFVQLLGVVGLVYVMFTAGLEIDLDIVRSRRRETVVFGLLAFVLSSAPAMGAGLWLGFSFRAAILMGAVISSHTLLAYPIIERLGLLHRPSVVAAIGGTLLTDTLALIVLAMVLPAQGGWVLPMVLLALLAGGSLWLVPRMSRWFLDYFQTGRAQKALFILAVLLVLSAATEMIGTHEILGAFLAGVCLNRVLHERNELREHVEFAGRMLFIPFFFVSTGMLLELDVFVGRGDVWLTAGLLTALVVFGKTAASWTAGRRYGYPIRDRLVMTGLTLPQAAATLAVTVTGQQAGLFPEDFVDAVILLIFVTCLAGPLLTRFAGRGLQTRLR
jgi:Kef-type K+ transport system membrane component KefB